MIARMFQALTTLLRPLRSFKGRSRFLERILGLQLSPSEFASIKMACEYGDSTLGSFYHWKIAQFSLAASVNRSSKEGTMELVSRSDESNYDRLDALADDNRGLLIATPHYGHFVMSIVAVAKRLSVYRPVFVFYDPPAVHTSNEIFDVLHKRLFGDAGANVSVIHNNRAGIACALKELHRGSVVVIMPDVYKDVHDTFQIPFCGRTRNAMLGTAVLARKTNCVVLPMLSSYSEATVGFGSSFGEPIFPEASEHAAGKPDPEASAYADYRLVLRMFQEFERLMARNLIPWQYSRNHFVEHHGSLPTVPPGDVDRVAALFLADPRIHVDLSSPLTLD